MADTGYLTASRLSTDISSSIGSQCIPIPPPINRHRFRCSGVAFKSLGNQTIGTAISRPSARTTRSASSVQFTSTAKGSTLTAKVLTVSLLKYISILLDDLLNLGKLSTTKATRTSQRHRTQPKLCISLSLLYVNVWRLLTLRLKKKNLYPLTFKTVGTPLDYSQNFTNGSSGLGKRKKVFGQGGPCPNQVKT